MLDISIRGQDYVMDVESVAACLLDYVPLAYVLST